MVSQTSSDQNEVSRTRLKFGVFVVGRGKEQTSDLIGGLGGGGGGEEGTQRQCPSLWN